MLLYAAVCCCTLQHPSGYEAVLDPWLQQLWRVLRQHCPLPPGVTQVGRSTRVPPTPHHSPLQQIESRPSTAASWAWPYHATLITNSSSQASHHEGVYGCVLPVPAQPVLDEKTMLQLGPPRFNVTLLTSPPQHWQQQQQGCAGSDPATNHQQPQTGQQREQQLIEQAVAAAAAFRAVAARSSRHGGQPCCPCSAELLAVLLLLLLPAVLLLPVPGGRSWRRCWSTAA